MKIPLARPEITEADIQAVTEVLRSSRLSQGAAMPAFEEALARYIGVDHAVTVNSGTTALQLALRALEIGEGDEVILPSFSFMAVTNAVLNERAVPVFADVEEGTFNLDPAALEPLLSAKTRAIIVVHTFGYPAAIKPAMEFAERHGLYVIEDACEALGAAIAGRKVGSFGHAAILAFYPNKQITTGEGGALLTHSLDLAEKVRLLRNQGRQISSDWFQNMEAGGSYRLSDINCALGLQQLARIEQIIARREELGRTYERKLASSEAATYSGKGRISRFTYPVLVPDRHEVWRRMTEAGVECARYFAPAHVQPVMRKFDFRCGDLSRTLSLASRVLCLPFFNEITEAEIELVAQMLGKALAIHSSQSDPETKRRGDFMFAPEIQAGRRLSPPSPCHPEPQTTEPCIP